MYSTKIEQVEDDREMYTNFKHYIQSMALKKKFNYITFLSVLWVGILSIFTTLNMIQRYDALLYRTNAHSLRNVVSSIESKLDAISVLTDHMISNETIQSSLSTLLDTKERPIYDQAKRDAYDSLYYYLFSNKNILSVTLVLDDTTINIGDSIHIPDSIKQDLKQTAILNHGRFFWTTGDQSNGYILCVREIRERAYVSLRHLGTLYISVDIDRIVSESLAEINGKQYNFLLLSDETIITPLESPYGEISKNLLETDSPYTIQTVGGKKQFIVQGVLPNLGWSYLYFIDYDYIFQGIQRVKVQSALTIITVMAAAVFLTNIVIRRILLYFQILVQKMTHFGSGHLEPLPTDLDYSSHTDELGELNRNFDEMVLNFNKLINDNYVKQLLLKDAQIKALQQQINPHFLYNTLDSINWMAQNYGADDIAAMARSLGNLFRGAIRTTEDFIPLSKELEFLQSYIQIQSFRFKERLQYQLDIPATHASLLVPKMIIQPLVENAIKHGLEDSFETCLIRLSLEEQVDVYQILVSNTCSEFEPDLLEKIKNKELIPGGTGIGLSNIDQRLRLIYGDDYGLHFYNHENMAVAVVTIPKTNSNSAQ